MFCNSSDVGWDFHIFGLFNKCACYSFKSEYASFRVLWRQSGLAVLDFLLGNILKNFLRDLVSLLLKFRLTGFPLFDLVYGNFLDVESVLTFRWRV